MQREWVEGLSNNGEGLTIVATDRKTMRGSKSKEMNQKARHIVSLFLTDSKLVLTQNQVDEKSNEIPALIALLDNLNLENCVITMDAMHTQKNTKDLLKWIDYNSSISESIEEHITYDHNTHGRYEERICQVYDDLYQIEDNWKNVRRIITVY